jgi:hypothetical protein
MERPLTAVVLTFGVFLGLVVGVKYAVARRAWTDYRATRDSVPGLQKAAWALIKVTFTRGGLVVLLCLAAVGWAAVGGH